MRVTALHPNAYFVIVTIGKAVGTMAERLNAPNAIKQITICQYSQGKDKKRPLSDSKKRSKGVKGKEE